MMYNFGMPRENFFSACLAIKFSPAPITAIFSDPTHKCVLIAIAAENLALQS